MRQHQSSLPVSCILMLAIVLLLPVSASAFEHSRTCGDPPAKPCAVGQKSVVTRWRECPGIQLNQGGTNRIPLTGVRAELILAIDAWASIECSAITPHFLGLSSEARVGYTAGLSNENLVLFQDDRWPAQYDQSVLALTTVTFTVDTGEILDADIQVNTAGFGFGINTEVDGYEADLRNTLTHELGHLLGLEHSDNPDATMYAYSADFETSKRSLHPDDIAGLCEAYPWNGHELECDGPHPEPDPAVVDPDGGHEGESDDDGSYFGPPRPTSPEVMEEDDAEPIEAACTVLHINRGAHPPQALLFMAVLALPALVLLRRVHRH